LRTAFAVSLALCFTAAACSSEDAGPGDLGESCSRDGECLGALTCVESVCLGDVIVRGDVFFPNQDQPDDELGLALFYDRDVGAGDPLIPSRAALSLSFAAPVSYPVAFEINGVPAGAYDIVAFVVVEEGVILRGQAGVDIGDDGGVYINGTARTSVPISITGQSGIQYE
jgi:hypothetical protein